jgi:hypothetical protein
MRWLGPEERVLAKQGQTASWQAQERGFTQEAAVPGATMQPLPADTRTEE